MIVVVPMAGRGQRFLSAGILTPKPLIDVLGRPMLTWAMKSLDGIEATRWVFIILKEHDDQQHVTNILRSHFPDCSIIYLDDVTEGQLATVLTAKKYINTSEDVLIANCDTYIVSSLANDILVRPHDCAGIISVADLPGDRWSFAKVNSGGEVIEVTEKVRISDHASTGFYYFSRGNQLVEVAEDIIANREKVRGEFYVIMAYKKYIERGWKVTLSHASQMWDMGTPESLKEFIRYMYSR